MIAAIRALASSQPVRSCIRAAIIVQAGFGVGFELEAIGRGGDRAELFAPRAASAALP